MNTDFAVSWWFLSLVGLLVVCVLRSAVQPNPLRILDHVNYLSGTLGTGKTSFGTMLAAVAGRKLPVYSTFRLEGAKPLDVSMLDWPTEPCVIVIDELLMLLAEKLVDWGALTAGLARARHRGQKVLILSQAHRCEPLQRKGGWGTIGMFLQVRGLSFGKLGRLMWVRRAAEPFRRTPKGYQADKVWKSWHWVPARVFSRYVSGDIYGYTIDLAGNPMDPRDARAAAAERVAGRQPSRFQDHARKRLAAGEAGSQARAVA